MWDMPRRRGTPPHSPTPARRSWRAISGELRCSRTQQTVPPVVRGQGKMRNSLLPPPPPSWSGGRRCSTRRVPPAQGLAVPLLSAARLAQTVLALGGPARRAQPGRCQPAHSFHLPPAHAWLNRRRCWTFSARPQGRQRTRQQRLRRCPRTSRGRQAAGRRRTHTGVPTPRRSSSSRRRRSRSSGNPGLANSWPAGRGAAASLQG